MARVNIRGVRINLAADPASGVSLHPVPSFARVTERPARVVRFAGGRTRVIARAGKDRAWRLSALFVPAVDVAWLEEHAGELVCVRDPRGHKMFGTFTQVSADEVPYRRSANLALTFVELTHSEEV